ncbi:MAG: hypothetical protein ABT940_05595 [Alphaproteobacteria bacterium]
MADESADVRAKLDLLIEITRGLQGRMDRQDDRQREVEGAMRELAGRVAEQSNILQVAIASRMGRKPAA